MEEKTYNGWTNYETWLTALWMGNDQGSEAHWTEAAKDAVKAVKTVRKSFTKEEEAAFVLADRIKSEIGEACPDLGTTLYADLMGAALSEVNWYEIAKHRVEDLE